MTTTAFAVDRIAADCGFPKPRVRAVARSETDTGRLPSGAPGRAPELDVWHFVDIVIGCTVDVPLRAVSAEVAKYCELVPGGCSDVPGAMTAGETLNVLADMAVHGTPDARADVAKMKIEIVSTWPEIARHDGIAIKRFVAAGANPARWQSTGHRASVTINGSAFVDAVRTLFGAK